MTEVCVPKTCTVRLDNFPHYQPGTLLNTILSWKFSEYVPKHSNVLIYCENECKSLAMILKSVLCERRHSHVKGTKGDFKRDRKRGQNVLIIIGKMDSNFSLLSSCKLVIVLQGCLSEAVRQYFTFQRERELVCLNASDLLTEKNITICLRAIVPWLKSYHQEMSLKSKATKDLLLSATFPIVSYTSKMHTLTLQVVNDAVVNEACSSVKVTKKFALALPIRNPLCKLFSKGGVYVVTGGTTGLGWEITILLIEMGAATVATISRRGINSEKENEITNIEKKFGCKIVNIKGDVTNLKSLENAMHEIQERSGSASIRGIFHCAGVLHGKLLSNIEENDIDIVLKPKVIGSMNLHHVTNGLDLDYFVVSSSINSLIGIPGQSSYGAANCFLDDFIDWRRKRGLAGQSILWGPLNVGMASRPEFIDNFAKRGFNLLSVAEVRCCLQAALMQNSTNIVYADINWETMSKNYSVPMMERHRNIMSVLFDQLVSCHDTFDEDSSFYEFDITSLRDASKQEQYSALTRFILHAASKVTGEVDPSTSIDVKLTDLGLDSMSILTFINVVQDYTRYRIPAAFMSNIDRTFRDIIQLLAEKLFEQINSVS